MSAGKLMGSAQCPDAAPAPGMHPDGLSKNCASKLKTSLKNSG